jgi:tetratricopeptide (TPR) repeat protein
MFDKGLEYFRKSLDLGILANNPIMIAFAKGLMSTFNYIYYGKIDSAFQLSKESLQMAQDSGDVYITGMASSSYGIACYFKGLFDEAEKSILQGITFCKKTAQLGWRTWASGFLAHMYSDMGEYDRAQDYFKKGVLTLERARIYPFWVNMWKVSIAKSKVLNNDRDINLDEVFDHYKNINAEVAKGWTARYLGEILLNIDDQNISEAEDWIKKAIEVDKSNGMMWQLGRDYSLYTELFKRTGDQFKAKENLVKAIDILNECGADGWVKKYEKELAEL